MTTLYLFPTDDDVSAYGSRIVYNLKASSKILSAESIRSWDITSIDIPNINSVVDFDTDLVIKPAVIGSDQSTPVRIKANHEIRCKSSVTVHTRHNGPGHYNYKEHPTFKIWDQLRNATTSVIDTPTEWSCGHKRLDESPDLCKLCKIMYNRTIDT